MHDVMLAGNKLPTNTATYSRALRPSRWQQLGSLCFELLTPACIKTSATCFDNWISLSLQVKRRWGNYWVGSDRRAVRSHWGQRRGTDLLPNQTDFPKCFYFSWIWYGGRSQKIESPQPTLNPSDTNCLHDRVSFKENINVQKKYNLHTHTSCGYNTLYIYRLMTATSEISAITYATPTCVSNRLLKRDSSINRYERRGTAVAQKYGMYYLKCLVTSKILGQISRVIFSH
jgi:hypothetical protein